MRRPAGVATLALAAALTLRCAVAVHAPVASGQANAPRPWSDLFDHKSLAGWVAHGPAQFTVEDGVLVGHAVATNRNSFLCTEARFDDFELEVEFRCDGALNSGVQVRSDFDLANGRFTGNQIEIDADVARGRLWSGGIYDEGRRGWLDPADGEKDVRGIAFSEQGRRLALAAANEKSRDGWSWLHVVAHAGELTAWLDGELRGHIHDSKDPRGVIGLQVHAVDEKTLKAAPNGELAVRFRNVRIRTLPKVAMGMGDSDAATDAAVASGDLSGDASANRLADDEARAGWRVLWDGATNQGWRSATSDSFPDHGWTIDHGVLTVGASAAHNTAESAGGGDILTRERFADFELRVDFKLTPGANSGIKYFVQPNLRPITASGEAIPATGAATGSAIGCEFQLLDDLLHPDAKLGRDGNRTLAALYDLIPPANSKPARAIGEWNTAHVVARGRHVEHWLNGTKILEFDRGSDAFRQLVAQSKYKNLPHFGEWPDGHILLQEHGSEVSFRNVKIRRLPPE